MAQIPKPGWCRAATAISMARLSMAAPTAAWHGLQNQRHWGADHFVFIHWRQGWRVIQTGWCRAATAISMARLPAAAQQRWHGLQNQRHWGADHFVFIHWRQGWRISRGLVQGSDGNFYGTTQRGGNNGGAGTVFKISATGALTTLYSFTGGKDGGVSLRRAGAGQRRQFLWHDFGGTNGDFGTVFKISATGALTTLYSFTGGNDGANPSAGLVQGSDGNFYGTTGGGTNGAGTVFKISANGALTTLYSFTGGNDGAGPYAGLVQGSDGNFYGTTNGFAPGRCNRSRARIHRRRVSFRQMRLR